MLIIMLAHGDFCLELFTLFHAIAFCQVGIIYIIYEEDILLSKALINLAF